MKKLLKKLDREKELYYYLNGEKWKIDRADLSTYPSSLTGKISSRLYGKISSRLYGDINDGLEGEISGVEGDCTSISGNIDDCCLVDEERQKGVNIQDLIQ